MKSSQAKRVVILGAGISGLSAAYELVRASQNRSERPEVLVLEASHRIGGKILSEAKQGVIYEAGPDSFLSAKPEVLDLAKELGISGDLVGTSPGSSAVSIYFKGRLRPLRGGLWPPKISSLLGSGLLGWRGMAHLALKTWAAKEASAPVDESLADFVRRRFGTEVLDAVAGPLLAGIYAGDPEELSLESAFPQLKTALSRNGGARAPWRPSPGQSLFMTFQGGLSRLVEALARALPARTVQDGVRAQALARRGQQWVVQTKAGEFLADAVISTVPANALAPLIEGLDPEMAVPLREIPFASTATVSLLYENHDLPAPFAGFGFMVPIKEGRPMVAATYSSSKFPGRAPAGKTLVRCFLGGAGRDAIIRESEETLVRVACDELSRILRLPQSCRPRQARAWKWLEANPQYTVGHGLRLKRLESCLRSHPGLILAGASYRGVGLPDCVRSGRAASRKVLSPNDGSPAVV